MFSWAENPVWQLKGRYLKIVFAIGNLANFEICGKLNRFLKNVLNQMGDFFFFPLRKLKISCLGNWTLVTERNWLFKWNPKSQLPLLKKNKETNLTPYLVYLYLFCFKNLFSTFSKRNSYKYSIKLLERAHLFKSYAILCLLQYIISKAF